jgi:tRNA-2-methylthio-N6-dimethylallyladenosine synthase
VLFEKRGREPGQLVGRSPWLQAVHAPAPDTALGRIVEVDIAGAGRNSLSAVLAA